MQYRYQVVLEKIIIVCSIACTASLVHAIGTAQPAGNHSRYSSASIQTQVPSQGMGSEIIVMKDSIGIRRDKRLKLKA